MDIELLEKLISIPSPSRDEKAVADMLEAYLWQLAGAGAESHCQQLIPHRVGNNLWCESCGNCGKPTIMLNAHIDTVKPANGWKSDPFSPTRAIVNSEPDGMVERIYGLGANDDGGSVVAMIEAYRILAAKEQPYRLVLTLSAEEEVSGRGGIEMLFPEIGNIDLAIVGEPTGMQMAVAEKGLMVLDCCAMGKSGHAARNEGVNAIYNALPAIEWFKSTTVDRVSPFLGPVKMSVTQIQAGTQHNVVPDACTFVVDVRSNELYTNEELLEVIEKSVSSISIKARSTRLGSSRIDIEHPVVKRGMALGLKSFGSPTLSNQALLHCPSLKIGPGDSARSHTANEYIEIREIEQAVEVYVKLLDGLKLM